MEQVNERTSLLPKAVRTEGVFWSLGKVVLVSRLGGGNHSPAAYMGCVMSKGWGHRAIPNTQVSNLGWLLLGSASLQ